MPTPPSDQTSSCQLFPTARCRISVRPLTRETTLSFLDRLAGRFRASVGDLIAESVYGTWNNRTDLAVVK